MAGRNGASSDSDADGHDYDWLVIGSGFGGSVAALRLAEKGYRVGILECGRRYEDGDFAKSTWRMRRYFWMPRLGMRGILRMTVFKDIFIVSGSGVGGGSLGYANTLYRARPSFYGHPQWAGLSPDWEAEMAPHYETAERMLGVVENPAEGTPDKLLREFAEENGVGDTYARTNVGVLFGERPGEVVGDPFFGGEGPERTTCRYCGSCMVGCRHGAKNTLRKNYLWFAEKLGVEIEAERTVTDVRPIGTADGSEGYEVTSRRSGAWLWRRKRVHTARGVVFAAGPIGTNKLLRDCTHRGSLPQISGRLGDLVRTNSESILAVTVNEDDPQLHRRIAITSSIYPDPDTHIELVTYGEGGGAMRYLQTLLTGEGTRLSRPVLWARQVVRHPIRFLRTLWPWGWARRTMIVLVMQALDNAIRFVPKRRLFGLLPGVRLQTEQDPEKPNPTFIPVANRFAEWLAERTGGTATAGLTEAILNIPSTAHILGGAVIGADPDSGVIDGRHRVFGYANMLVTDGAAVPANPGVNPSLTITALAERALTFVPPAPEAELPELPRAARGAAPVTGA